MPRCCMCHEDKAEEAFAFRSLAAGVRQSHCRACHAAYRREHYLRNRDAYVRREVARIEERRRQNRTLLLMYLAAHPCVDCGETDPVVLEFDHRESMAKSAPVTVLALTRTWTRVLAEIAKCDVRCVTCHRRRTAAQFAWSKLRLIDQALIALDDRKGYLARTTQRDRVRGRDARKLVVIRYLLGHPCVDCGETDVLLLEFDHRDPSMKVDAVGTLLADGTMRQLTDEIAKCEVRCVRCHRIKTAKDFGWSRLGEEATMYVFAGVA